MNRILGFVVFVSLAVGIYFGIHYFVYQRIARAFELASGQRLLLRLFFCWPP